jgi:hypothetical protein
LARTAVAIVDAEHAANSACAPWSPVRGWAAISSSSAAGSSSSAAAAIQRSLGACFSVLTVDADASGSACAACCRYSSVATRHDDLHW